MWYMHNNICTIVDSLEISHFQNDPFHTFERPVFNWTQNFDWNENEKENEKETRKKYTEHHFYRWYDWGMMQAVTNLSTNILNDLRNEYVNQ